MGTKKVKVIRAFYYDGGKMSKVNNVITLPSLFAIELVAANKAEFVVEIPENEEPVTYDKHHAKLMDSAAENELSKIDKTKVKGGKENVK